jgi:hypothetical protein
MKKLWIAEVKWNDGNVEYFGPFAEYDTGIKLWSSNFSFKHSGTFEYINYHTLNQKT